MLSYVAVKLGVLMSMTSILERLTSNPIAERAGITYDNVVCTDATGGQPWSRQNTTCSLAI